MYILGENIVLDLSNCAQRNGALRLGVCEVDSGVSPVSSPSPSPRR